MIVHTIVGAKLNDALQHARLDGVTMEVGETVNDLLPRISDQQVKAVVFEWIEGPTHDLTHVCCQLSHHRPDMQVFLVCSLKNQLMARTIRNLSGWGLTDVFLENEDAAALLVRRLMALPIGESITSRLAPCLPSSVPRRTRSLLLRVLGYPEFHDRVRVLAEVIERHRNRIPRMFRQAGLPRPKTVIGASKCLHALAYHERTSAGPEVVANEYLLCSPSGLIRTMNRLLGVSGWREATGLGLEEAFARVAAMFLRSQTQRPNV
jgi:hypothetical protein